MLVNALVIALAALLFSLIAIVMRPPTFRVERSIAIAASPERALLAVSAWAGSLALEQRYTTIDRATLVIEATPRGSRVTWTMDVRNGFAGKAIGIVVDLNERVGSDFERCLEALRDDVERPGLQHGFVA